MRQNPMKPVPSLRVEVQASHTPPSSGPYTPLTYTPLGGFSGQDGSSNTWRAGSLLIHKLERWGAADDVDYRDEEVCCEEDTRDHELDANNLNDLGSCVPPED